MANKKLNVEKQKENTGVTSGAVTANIERGADRHGQQAEATEDEKKERAAKLQTRGRKGCKLERISIGFSPDNIQFIKTMSAVMGIGTTDFVNMILDKYREENAESYTEAAAIYDKLFNSDLAKGK